MDISSIIRTIPDFPKRGIMFHDVTTVMADPAAMKYVVGKIVERFGRKIDAVVGMESRGFVFGAAVAYEMGAGFIPVRKKGKLPYKTINATYQKEYGPDSLEMHEDAIKKGQSVLIVDDLLATGGTARATIELVEKLGGKVAGLAFLVGMPDLKGAEKLKGYEVFYLVEKPA